MKGDGAAFPLSFRTRWYLFDFRGPHVWRGRFGHFPNCPVKVRKPLLHKLLASNAGHVTWTGWSDSSCCIIVWFRFCYQMYLGFTTNSLVHISSLLQVFWNYILRLIPMTVFSYTTGHFLNSFFTFSGTKVLTFSALIATRSLVHINDLVMYVFRGSGMRAARICEAYRITSCACWSFEFKPGEPCRVVTPR